MMGGDADWDGAGEVGLEVFDPRRPLPFCVSCGGGPAFETVLIAVDIALAKGMWGIVETVAATMAAIWSEYALR